MRLFKMPSKPIKLLTASGTRLITETHGTLIDFEAGCWANVLGHGRIELMKVINEHGARLFHTHHYFETDHPSALVAEIVHAANLDSDYDGTFLSSGSDAVSLAIMLAEKITGRTKKLCFSLSYLSTSPELRMPRNQETWLDLDIIGCLNCTQSCETCSKVNAIDFHDFSAFVFEPGNSGGQVLCPPNQLISYLTRSIRNADGLVIANEVTTGFGRTGKWFGFQHYDALMQGDHAPDLIAMGKGLGNGYPISGVLMRKEWADQIEKTDFHYVQSHTDDPIGCLVARKVVSLMLSENAVEKSHLSGEYFKSKLAEVQSKTQKIEEIRGRGLMVAIKLKEPVRAKTVFNQLLEKGCFVGCSEAANLIRFYPALNISHSDLDYVSMQLEQLLSIE